jgi:hypothetical protein
MRLRGGTKGREITKDFFGTHVSKATSFSSPQTTHFDLGMGAFRMWDCVTQWRKLEPTTKGVFDWGRFDAILAYCASHDYKIMYTYGQPPNWATGNTSSSQFGTDYNSIPPTDNQDWVDYVTAVASRLPAGSFHEIWNEPNHTGFYSGTKARLAELHILAYDTIKALDPTAVIVSACPTSYGQWVYLPDYLTPDVVAKTDAIGFHAYCYPREPEWVYHSVQNYKGILKTLGAGNLPMIQTENTWHDYYDNRVLKQGDLLEIMPDALSVSYVARSIFCQWLSGVHSSYLYMTDFSWSMVRFYTSLVSPTTLTPAALAHKYVAETLVGGYLWNFRQMGNYFTAKFQHRDGRQCLIQWCADDQTRAIDTTGYTSVNDCLGEDVAKSASYTLTNSPVFCFV